MGAAVTPWQLTSDMMRITQVDRLCEGNGLGDEITTSTGVSKKRS